MRKKLIILLVVTLLVCTALLGLTACNKMTYDKVEASAATCDAAGQKEHYVGSDEKLYIKDDKDKYVATTKEDLAIPALGHSYGEATYEWNADNTVCTAIRKCTNDASHIETITATITSEKVAATTTKVGKMTYTATFDKSWATTQTKEVVLKKISTITIQNLNKNYDSYAMCLDSKMTSNADGEKTVEYFKGTESLGKNEPINAGTYKVVVSYSEGEEYAANSVEQEFTISPITLTSNVENPVEIDWHEDNSYSFLVTDEDFYVLNSESGKINLNFELNPNEKGKQEITSITLSKVSSTDDIILSNYKIESLNAWIVDKPIFDETKLNKVYDGQPIANESIVTASNKSVAPESIKYYVRIPDALFMGIPSEVGVYQFKAKYGATEEYPETIVVGTFEIKPKEIKLENKPFRVDVISITLNAADGIYGSDDVKLTITDKKGITFTPGQTYYVFDSATYKAMQSIVASKPDVQSILDKAVIGKLTGEYASNYKMGMITIKIVELE